MTKEEAIIKAHAMYAYEESEKSDEETGDFDALWQSLYDVCQLATYGILDFDEDEINEAREWLLICIVIRFMKLIVYKD